MGRRGRFMKELDVMITEAGLDREALVLQTRVLLRAYERLLWQQSAVAMGSEAMSMAATLEEARCGVIVIDRLIDKDHPNPSIGPTRSGNSFVVDLMKQALFMTGCYPERGATYHTILVHSYFDHDLTDEAAAEKLHLERSIYYDRKKEATALFGYSLFAILLPDVRDML